jgi:hypothetical protein
MGCVKGLTTFSNIPDTHFHHKFPLTALKLPARPSEAMFCLSHDVISYRKPSANSSIKKSGGILGFCSNNSIPLTGASIWLVHHYGREKGRP